MKELEQLLDDMEKLRAVMIKLIEDKENLQDPEVIAASENLNKIISKYNELLMEKLK